MKMNREVKKEEKKEVELVKDDNRNEKDNGVRNKIVKEKKKKVEEIKGKSYKKYKNDKNEKKQEGKKGNYREYTPQSIQSKNLKERKNENNNDNVRANNTNTKNALENHICEQGKKTHYISLRKKNTSKIKTKKNNIETPILISKIFDKYNNTSKTLFKRDISLKYTTSNENPFTSDNQKNKSFTSLNYKQNNHSLFNNNLSSIFEKRRSFLEQKEKEEISIIQQLDNLKPLDIYNRCQLYRSKVQSKNKQIEDKLKESLIEECSFSPKITNRTNNLLNQSVKYQTYYSINDFYQRNAKWKYNIDKKVREKIRENNMKQEEECSFHPFSNEVKRCQKIIKETKAKGNNYIYEKNMKWVEHVNNNKKKGELEKMEEVKDEIRIFKEMNQQVINRSKKNMEELTSKEKLDILAKPKYRNEKGVKGRDYSNINKRNTISAKEFLGKEKGDGELKKLLQSLKDSIKENQLFKETIMYSSYDKGDTNIVNKQNV